MPRTGAKLIAGEDGKGETNDGDIARGVTASCRENSRAMLQLS